MPRKISTEREQFWRRHIDRQRAGRLSIRDYCDRQGLHEHSFYSWRRTIAERDHDGEAASSPPPLGAPAFLPVAVVDRPTRLPDSPIEIRLVDGRRVRIRAGCDRALLADVLAILHAVTKPEDRSC
jgi:transposase-like protein